MTQNLVICQFSELRYMILNLCTFWGHPVGYLFEARFREISGGRLHDV